MSESDESEVGRKRHRSTDFASSESGQTKNWHNTIMHKYSNRQFQAYARGEVMEMESSDDSSFVSDGDIVDKRNIKRFRNMKRMRQVDDNNFHTNWHVQLKPCVSSRNPVSRSFRMEVMIHCSSFNKWTASSLD